MKIPILPISLIQRLKDISFKEQEQEITKYLQENDKFYQLLLSLKKQESEIRTAHLNYLHAENESETATLSAFWHGKQKDVLIDPTMIAHYKRQDLNSQETKLDNLVKLYFLGSFQIEEIAEKHPSLLTDLLTKKDIDVMKKVEEISSLVQDLARVYVLKTIDNLY